MHFFPLTATTSITPFRIMFSQLLSPQPHPQPNPHFLLSILLVLTRFTAVTPQQAAMGESSYNIYGQFLPYQSSVDASTLRKNCFDGFRQRRCHVRESYRETAGSGWMQYDTAGLNLIDAESSEGKYFCLTCCSNTRLSSEILEQWDLSCETSPVDYQRVNIGKCKEFRILRNRDLYDQEVLHCRVYRETETWEPPAEIYDDGYYRHRSTNNKI